MKRVLIAASLGLTMLGAGGCVSGVTMAGIAETRTSEPVSETNYILGQQRTAVVGEPIVRVKDYVRVRVTVPAVAATQTGSLMMGINPPVQVVGGREYPIVGERLADTGERYRLVGVAGMGLQLRADGSIHNKALVESSPGIFIEPIPELNYSPATLRFDAVTRVDESSIAAGENYEIVFTGRDASSMRFQYREYTSEDMARPAFSQDLTYPVGAKTIRFRGLTIEISALGEDSVTYSVVAREPSA